MKTPTSSVATITPRLLREVRACTLCARELPLGPRPVLQASTSARILIAGQAPGSRVHQSGIPFDDPSGERLRAWMGIGKDIFHDAKRIAILPMGFCYPGTGTSGDFPPRPECAGAWRAKLLAGMPHIELTMVIGRYAQAWHLGKAAKATLTETVTAWRDYWPNTLPLPHPSPRNNIWLKRNAWFDGDVLPALRKRVTRILGG